MSTRANVLIKDKFGDELWFYRHCDGYPDGALPTLVEFLDWVASNRVRTNVAQAAGWLVVLGHREYLDGDFTGTPVNDGVGMGWKVGSYQPTLSLHGDIEFLYVIDLAIPRIDVYDRDFRAEPTSDGEYGHLLGSVSPGEDWKAKASWT